VADALTVNLFCSRTAERADSSNALVGQRHRSRVIFRFFVTFWRHVRDKVSRDRCLRGPDTAYWDRLQLVYHHQSDSKYTIWILGLDQSRRTTGNGLRTYKASNRDDSCQ